MPFKRFRCMTCKSADVVVEALINPNSGERHINDLCSMKEIVDLSNRNFCLSCKTDEFVQCRIEESEAEINVRMSEEEAFQLINRLDVDDSFADIRDRILALVGGR